MSTLRSVPIQSNVKLYSAPCRYKTPLPNAKFTRSVMQRTHLIIRAISMTILLPERGVGIGGRSKRSAWLAEMLPPPVPPLQFEPAADGSRAFALPPPTAQAPYARSFIGVGRLLYRAAVSRVGFFVVAVFARLRAGWLRRLRIYIQRRHRSIAAGPHARHKPAEFANRMCSVRAVTTRRKRFGATPRAAVTVGGAAHDARRNRASEGIRRVRASFKLDRRFSAVVQLVPYFTALLL